MAAVCLEVLPFRWLKLQSRLHCASGMQRIPDNNPDLAAAWLYLVRGNSPIVVNTDNCEIRKLRLAPILERPSMLPKDEAEHQTPKARRDRSTKQPAIAQCALSNRT